MSDGLSTASHLEEVSLSSTDSGFVDHRRIQGAIQSWPSIRSAMSPAVKDFYHTKMTHILVSVYSVFIQPHSTSEPITVKNIHIVVYTLYINVYTCIYICQGGPAKFHLDRLRGVGCKPLKL